jgi:hypothetical protein
MDSFGNKRVPNKPPGFKGFNSYAAGKKVYGGGRSMPNIGRVSGSGQMGYNERDNKSRAMKSAVLRRLKGQMSGSPMSPDIMLGDLKRGK